MAKKRIKRALSQNNALGLAAAGVEPLGVEEKQTLKMRVDLFDESIVATRYEDGAPTTAYELAPEDLAAAFADVPLATGLLSPGCLFYSRSGNQDRVALYLPGKYRSLSVEWGKKPVSIKWPLPPLVFTGCGVDYAVYAVKRYPKHPGERLFRAPFPNVYDSGSICPGNVTFPICSTETIHAAADLFLESNFNRHLSAGKCRSHKNVVTLWRALAREKPRRFPLAELIATGQTVGDLIGR